MTTTASASTIALLSACSFVGNVGAALTGFGQAIIFLFVWQIVDLAGYEGDFKYAVFVQALSLFSMQPLLLRNAQIVKHAHRRILLLFVPITLVSTPLGQLVSGYVPTKIIQAVAGVLVTLVALWELYCKRNWFLRPCKKENGVLMKDENSNDKVDVKADVGMGLEDQTATPEKDDQFEDNQEEDTKDEANTGGETSIPDAFNDQEPEAALKIIGCNKASWYTLLAGGASGFLGGMVGIRGPPLIFYFLHPPHPVTFNKNSQRATGVVIMFCNVLMRQIFYLVNTFTDSDQIGYEGEDWRLYVSIIVVSIAGGFVGDKLFHCLKDSQDTIRGILAIFLFVCGVSLMISAFS